MGFGLISVLAQVLGDCLVIYTRPCLLLFSSFPMDCTDTSIWKHNCLAFVCLFAQGRLSRIVSAGLQNNLPEIGFKFPPHLQIGYRQLLLINSQTFDENSIYINSNSSLFSLQFLGIQYIYWHQCKAIKLCKLCATIRTYFS